jgi:hypothetical protein
MAIVVKSGVFVYGLLHLLVFGTAHYQVWGDQDEIALSLVRLQVSVGWPDYIPLAKPNQVRFQIFKI